ncbi:MAG: hypothetical protein GY855_13560, partial [candidate division Zixibacteria bacterium]|nr:hypothetical protein [candidate division Zixibacteria bacterium]
MDYGEEMLMTGQTLHWTGEFTPTDYEVILDPCIYDEMARRLSLGNTITF